MMTTKPLERGSETHRASHRSTLARLGLLLVSALTPACRCAEQAVTPDEARQIPKPPPPPGVSVPPGLSIPVEVDGKNAPPIDGQTLEATKPSFQDGEHRAWLLGSLLAGEAGLNDMEITIVGEGALEITMPRTSSTAEVAPVLVLNRRGEVMAAMVSPKDPFPSYHGRGRRLSRGGDPLPRISGKIVKIKLSRPRM